MDLDNPDQDKDYSQSNANATASVKEAEIDADFDVGDDLENPHSSQNAQNIQGVVVDKSMNTSHETGQIQNPADADDLEQGYVPLPDAPEDMEEDSNMADHLPPIVNETSKQAEKARKKEQKLKEELDSLKQLSLEDKIALLKKFDPAENYKVGSFVDATDTTDTYCLAHITQINGVNLQVNFDGWSNKWDLWFRIKSFKVAPFRSKHSGYSGQQKTAIRNHLSWDISEMRLLRKQIDTVIANDLEGKNAQNTTQYLRGHLYTYSDFLLGLTIEEIALPEVIDFQKAVLRLAVTYLKKVTTMQKQIYELSQNSELFLIDPMCAILASYPEIMDMVKRLFCCCQRALRFYLFNDVNQVQPETITKEVQQCNDEILPNTFGVIVQDFTEVDFDQRRITDEAKYIPEASKQRIVHKDNLVFGQMVNFVQYFADIGGFNAIINLLELGHNQPNDLQQKKEESNDQKPIDYSSQKIDLPMISSLILPLKNLGQVVTKQFKESICKIIKDLIVDRLMNMTEKNLKDVDKDSISTLINNFKHFLSLGHTDQETAQIIETTQLYVSLRFLKCGNLEKRLRGLNDIRLMVERVVQYANKNDKKMKNKYAMQEDSPQSKVKPSEFLTIENLRDWISENKVLEIILGGNAHIEIVKRCGPILKFMSVYGQDKFDAQTVTLVWKCQLGKHEEMVRTVYNLIQEVLPSLSLELVDSFYDKIKEMPPQQYDEKFLIFLREYTKMALTKRNAIQKQQFAEEMLKKRQLEKEEEIDLDEDGSEDFDTELANQEKVFLSALTIENLGALADTEVKHLYGLPIFWSICQDAGLLGLSFSSDQKHIENLRQISLNSMLEMFDQLYRKQIRVTFLFKSLKNIIQKVSVVQSLQVAMAIIKSFYIDQIHSVRNRQNYRNWEEDEQDQEAKQNEEQPRIILFLQNQLHIMNALLDNIAFYHAQVKQKMKVFVEKNKVPENVDDSIFAGQYSHQSTLSAVLEFIEYVVIQSQNDNEKSEQTEVVSIGIENIKKLWHFFVSEPNFNSDQNLFLNWINKQRFQQVRGGANTQAQYYNNQQVIQNEMHIFTEAEKKFLFSSILCNSNEVDINQVTVSLVKVFQKYFRSINKAEGNINSLKKKIKVLKFDDLLGMETLWNIALHSPNEKVKEVVHELLVDLHLKFDYSNVTLEHKANVISRFIEQCMLELEATESLSEIQNGGKGAIQLISLFLDRYEGKRPIMPEASIASRLNNIKPQVITVINCLDMNNKTQRQLQISYFQTLGYLRNQIAELFGLQLNQFHMIIRSTQIDPELEDDNYIKDIQGLFNQVSIKLNKNYEPNLHPKFLLSNNEKHFNTIFQMLRGSQSTAGLTELVWALISKLPQNANICEQFESLLSIKKAFQAGKIVGKAWSQLLDEQSIFKLLYCLKIINNTYLTPVTLQKREDEGEEEKKSEGKNHALERQIAWRIQFIQLGGLTHLLFCLANLNLDEINNVLELVCIKTLLEIIFKFITSNSIQKLNGGKNQLELQEPFLLRTTVLKIIKYIDLICKYSIQEEKSRGQSFELIEKRITNAKQRKDRYKLMIQGNKADAVKKQVDEDDNDSNEDKNLLQKLTQNFTNQIEIVGYLFNFMNQVMNRLPESASVIIEYKELEQMFVRGMLLTENQLLRKRICTMFKDIITTVATKPEFPQSLITNILHLQVSRVLPLTIENESRSQCFYEMLQEIIGQLPLNHLVPLYEQLNQLINSLTESIIQREIKEQTTADKDIFLQGQMQVLSRLLQKFPEQKNIVGKTLTHYLVHECLFEIPHGNKGANSAPKCKSHDSRKAAFNLLATISRDSIEQLNIILDYMSKFSTEVSWRTKKDTDWNIKFYDDEKSATGHVGIKNLGCICYMNSLNQQLFMIPGFRNDILTIKDPNHDKNPDEDNMFLQWQTLFAGLLLSEKMYVNPKAYCHSFKDWEGEPINIIEQMDVEEYLNMFMDRLETAIKGTPQAQTIQYHFGGTFANEIICKTCPHSYVRTENFLNVGIPVMNKKNLYEGLDAFVKGDMLEESNQYMCEKCEKKVDALKRTCLQKLPRYMIMTLKRFEFDLDRMVRVKLNDFYEFKEEIDVSEYTQEYLNAKEKAQKVQQSDAEGEVKVDSKEELLKTLKQPREYYQYELVGIVVHSGTADSGHYYSYIKEQEAFKKQGDSDKWYEFNDIWVREFDPAEIPTECYGGEETSYQSNTNWNTNTQQKFMKFRNAYLLVYKRKLTDDQLIVKEDAESENLDVKKEVQKYQLGSEELKMDVTSPLYKKIAADNHKYWQNRFLFGTEYFEFVQQIILFWNTNRVIPYEVSWRNNDYHLLDQRFAIQYELAKKPMIGQPPNDIKIPLEAIYDNGVIQRAKLQVFKFATQFYVSILQRSYDKNTLPDTVKYIRTYINDDETCARWLISEFINFDVLTECFLENTMPFMRQILAGMLYCAMLKVWDSDRRKINLYWEDLKLNAPQPRYTMLGNLILCLLHKLPKVLDYNNNQSQWFQMLARFSNLGPEARLFLLNAKTIDRCMNYFHIKDTPYQQEFLERPMLPFQLKIKLDIGMPTADDPNQKMSAFAMLKEKQRLKKLQNDSPKYQYLIETVSNCIRALHVDIPSKLQDVVKNTPLAHEDSGFSLTDNETTLIMPQADFIEKFVCAATKPRSMTAVAKAYIHHCYYNPQHLQKMWETVIFGLKKYDYKNIKPFLILFQYMLEARESPAQRNLINIWLEDFFQNLIPTQLNVYQWMEVVIDFVIKIGFRIPEVKNWMASNVEHWTYLLEWLKANPEPPQQTNYYSGQQYNQMRMNKDKKTKLIQNRYDKNKNQTLLFVRRTNLITLKDSRDVPDLSQEIDLDQFDLTDYKYIRESKIEYSNDNLYPKDLQACYVVQEMEELLSIKWIQADNQLWEAQEKNRMYPAGVICSTYRNSQIEKVSDAILNKHAQERAKQQQLLQQQQMLARSNAGTGAVTANVSNRPGTNQVYESSAGSAQGSGGTQQDRDWQDRYANEDDAEPGEKHVQQDAEMEFQGDQNDYEYSNNYENFEALDPASNAAVGKYSQDPESNESDEDMQP